MKATKLWFANNRLYVENDKGEILYQSLLYYPRLQNATEVQRLDYELWEYGIKWDSIDEDVSYESFSYDNHELKGIAKLFLTNPELNASAIARRLGMNQSLLAQ